MAHKGNKHGRARSKVSREARRKSAAVIAEERKKRPALEQLALLDQRLGKGVGAVRERKRLAVLIK